MLYVIIKLLSFCKGEQTVFEQLNETALLVIKKIEHDGYKAFIAGATVRELIMSETPVAYVLITTATTARIKALFRKTVDNRLHNNSVTVIENKTAFNIFCSNNSDSSNQNNDIKKLLSCFDFTINSMAYSPDTGIIDHFNGMTDISNKTIRLVDSSQQAISEKPIRMLRAVRYSALLGFRLDPQTELDIKKYSILIKKASNDKIREEFDKILMTDNPGVIMDMNELGLLKHIIPELDICFSVPQKNKYHIYNVGEHIIHAVMSTPNDTVIRWAALLHDIGKPICKSVDANGIIHFYGHHRESVRLATEILRRLKVDNQLTKEILVLIENHDVRIEPTPQGVKRMMMRTGSDVFPKLLILQEADNMAKNMRFFQDKLNKLNDIRRIYQKVLAERHPYRISDLAINGRDLNKLGFRAGHEIGDTLLKLLEEILIDPGLNTREYLLMRARIYRKKRG